MSKPVVFYVVSHPVLFYKDAQERTVVELKVVSHTLANASMAVVRTSEVVLDNAAQGIFETRNTEYRPAIPYFFDWTGLYCAHSRPYTDDTDTLLPE